MMMPKEKREILKDDIMPLDVYTKKRKELRKKIVDLKKNRRIPLGPYATFYFESFEKKWCRGSRSLSWLLWDAIFRASRFAKSC